MSKPQAVDNLKDIIKGITIVFTIINCAVLLYYAHLTALNGVTDWFILDEWVWGLLAVIALGLTVWVLIKEKQSFLIYSFLLINIASLPILNGNISSQFLFRFMEPLSSLTRLQLSPENIYFEYAGETREIGVRGLFGNGTIMTLNKLFETHFSSDNPDVATVSSNGLVTAVGRGKSTTTKIHVKNRGISATATIFVPKTITGDLDGNGYVNQDDLNILYSSLGLSRLDDTENIPDSKRVPVKPFDARDLNHDGFLDKQDVEIMKKIIGKASLNIQSNCEPHSPAVNQILICEFGVLNKGPDVAKNAGMTIHFELTGPGVKPVTDNKRLFYTRIELVSDRISTGDAHCLGRDLKPKPNTFNIGCGFGDIPPKNKALAVIQVRIKSPGRLNVEMETHTRTPVVVASNRDKTSFPVEVGGVVAIPKQGYKSIEEVDIEELVQILRKSIANGDRNYVIESSNELLNFGALVFQRLKKLVLEDPDAEVRRTTVNLLGSMSVNKDIAVDTVPVLMLVFKKDRDDSVRFEVIRNRFGYRNVELLEDVIPVLLDFLNENPSKHADAVRAALTQIGPSSLYPLQEYLKKTPKTHSLLKGKEILDRLRKDFPEQAKLLDSLKEEVPKTN